MKLRTHQLEKESSLSNSSEHGGGSTEVSQLCRSEDDGLLNNPQKASDIKEVGFPISQKGIDLTQSFETDQVFDSRDAMFEWCQEVAKKKNTRLIIRKSQKKPAGKGSFIVVVCERSGVYQSHSNKIDTLGTEPQKRGSKKCGCPFTLRGACLLENKWKLRVNCGRHNHEVESNPVSFNRWKQVEEQLLLDLTAKGAPPQQVLQALKEKHKNNDVNLRTIYNKRSKLKQKEVESKSVMQQDAGPVNHPHKDSNVMEENTPALSVRIDVAQCFQTNAGPVNHPQKQSILMEEDTLISKAGIDMTQCFQNDQGKGLKNSNMMEGDAPISKEGVEDEIPVSDPPKDGNMMEADSSISKKGMDVTQFFQTDQLFDSRDAAFEWCQEVADKNKTRVIIGKSETKPAGKGSFVLFVCDRSGVYRYTSCTPDTRKRQRRESKKCDCPFKVRGTCLPENKWRLRVLCGRHNHEAENTSVPLFNRDEEQLGVKLTASGDRPQQVLEALKEKNKECLASTSGSAIYNTRSKLKLKEVARKSVAQEDAGSVNHPHKDSNVMEENTPASNERINVARCFQTDAGPVSHLQKESILMEEDTLISKVGIDVTQCFQTYQGEGPVKDPLNGSNMMEEDVPTSKEGMEITHFYQTDQNKISPEDVNMMEDDAPIWREGMDVTQFFQTDQLFDSRDAAFEWCQEVARENNTRIIIRKSETKPEGKGSFVLFACNRSGVYRYTSCTPDARKRQRRETKKCGCPFKVRGTCLPENKWRLRVLCGRHNHEAENIPLPLFNRDVDQLVVKLTASGARPRQVVEALKQKNKDCLVSAKDIYNRRSSLKRHVAEKMSVMEQVMKLSTQYHYMVWYRKDEETNELKDIVWAHPESTLLAKCFPSMLMIDCTYKTNRFKVPFFHVAGISSLGTPFTVAYAFIEEETKEHFSWALTQLKSLFFPHSLPSVCVMNGDHPLINAVRSVFPEAKRLLCTLHIGECVVTNCRKAISDDKEWDDFHRDWECVLKSETKEDFADTYTEFVTTWVTRYPTCIKYIRDTWIVHKESFILCWTRKIKHFGYKEVSTDESEHEQLRKHMESSTSTTGFFRCWEAMHSIVKDQINQISASNEKSLTYINRKHQIPAFGELKNHVSQHALDLILLELEQLAVVESQKDIPQRALKLRQPECNQSVDTSTGIISCWCLISYMHGLPCAHEVHNYIQDGRPIPLSAIDQQWKQLSVVLSLNDNLDFICLPEVQLLQERWMEASESDRSLLQEQMKEVASSCDLAS
ncbi:uncharacterized protein LOC113347055 isoform X1 [Papaver somniferum]|uniref:uncharacterized protein LOC113347055 isoform X1 n=1 Tax=Papaver somniferum TaxID=3469 RepID=UPI000E7021B1|nr:uncharacterized protein LOC113347055 isoform X1 [Papaver somniferum]XP_026446425.1 uncharacterized protein LOC113347055 isoform X1 [Papaver somniferum]